MARVIVPGEASVLVGESVEGVAFKPNRLACRQVRQNKMNLAAVAGDQTGPCPLRGDGGAVRQRESDGVTLASPN